jgi:exopolysaccharide production protein ExoQ
MPVTLVLVLWFVLLVGLIRFDPARKPGVSSALWVPIIEFIIVGSRLPSQWLATASVQSIDARTAEDGNGFDRTIYILLIAVSIGILVWRSFNWRAIASRHIALIGLLVFALLSVVWSDYPFVAFKRWFRDLSIYATILVVFTERDPLAALHTLYRRVCYALIPLSVVFVKYYPEYGRHFEWWTGEQTYVGVTTSKNMLGVLCLLSGLFFTWDLISRWRDRENEKNLGAIAVSGAFLGMTLWLLSLANSATSSACLAMGCLLLVLAQFKPARLVFATTALALPVALGLYILLAFGFGMDLFAAVAGAVDRDPTLTGRTLIWETVLNLDTSLLFGTGHQTFWLGPRLDWIQSQRGEINEAHNGYIEVYLHLGLIGVALLFGFIVASFRRMYQLLREGSSMAGLGLTVWSILLIYNLTETSFLSGLLWMTTLAIAMSDAPQKVAAPQTRPVRSLAVRRQWVYRPAPSSR